MYSPLSWVQHGPWKLFLQNLLGVLSLFLVLVFISVYLLYFYRDVHAVCLWDDKGPAKIHQALKEDILEFIKQAQAVSSVS